MFELLRSARFIVLIYLYSFVVVGLLAFPFLASSIISGDILLICLGCATPIMPSFT